MLAHEEALFLAFAVAPVLEWQVDVHAVNHEEVVRLEARADLARVCATHVVTWWQVRLALVLNEIALALRIDTLVRVYRCVWLRAEATE